jgi:CubicO group peptidase (beta-lactamase class C family)
VPAVGGLWTTAADLVHFGRAWSSLLPDPLAREALRPQVERDDVGGQAGFGWMLMPPKDVAGHPGAGPGFCASLLIRPSTGQTWVVLTNRKVLVESVNERLAIPITSATRAG